MATRADADQLVDHRWNTPAEFNFAVDIVDRRARDSGGVALIWATATGYRGALRFSEVSHQTVQLAAVMRDHGLHKGDRLVIMLPRCPEWMITIVAALRLGLVPVPCIEMLTARDLIYRVVDSEARGIVCRAGQTTKFSDLPADAAPVQIALGGAPGWLDYRAEIAVERAPVVPATVATEGPAIMYYTSGCTGGPKGVLHAARALHAWRYAARYWLNLTPADKIWCTADTSWSKAGTSILFGPWCCGARVFLYDGPFDPASRVAELVRNEVIVYCAPATELSRVADAADSEAGFIIRRTVSAGEAVSPAIVRRWEAATKVRVDEAYGQTKALMLSLDYPGERVKYGSMGRPAPGCGLCVIDVDGRRLPPGEEGDLALETPNPQLMLGYWRNAERTEACFRSGPESRWFVTGDRALQDAGGYLWYCGRSDDVINSAGYRIGPTELENVLMDHPAVANCAVVGRPDAERGEIVEAFVGLQKGHEGSAALTAELQAHVKALTAPYKYPRSVELVAELLMTATGKVLRRELRDRERASIEQATT
jgi:acyl-coenzyme A synthetase/AMP-(fatty) acid ligase